jgi:catechol 2,3-dioxygenase-like lactoylglutathione lyase family enzyme
MNSDPKTKGDIGGMDHRGLYHHGVRVPDLDQAMAELGSDLNLEWCSVQETVQTIWTPDSGVHDVPLRFTYSGQGPVHLELLEGAPGSLWDGRENPGLHHLGLWCDDVRGATANALDKGWTVVMSQAEPSKNYGAFVYLRPPSGLIVELVWSGLKPMFSRWFAGGPLS